MVIIRKIERIIAWCAVWACYWLGHVTSKIMDYTHQWWLYDLYSWWMNVSIDINDKYGFDVWRKHDESK